MPQHDDDRLTSESTLWCWLIEHKQSKMMIIDWKGESTK